MRAIPQNKIANSVDEVADKDPKSRHEGTVKGHEGKQEEVVARPRYCSGSSHKKVFVVENEALQSRYSDFGAQLATTIEDLGEGIALDIESLYRLEQEEKKISEEIGELKTALDGRQELLDESVRLLVRMCMILQAPSFVNC